MCCGSALQEKTLQAFVAGGLIDPVRGRECCVYHSFYKGLLLPPAFMTSVKRYLRTILSTPGTAGYRLLYKQVLRVVPHSDLSLQGSSAASLFRYEGSSPPPFSYHKRLSPPPF